MNDKISESVRRGSDLIRAHTQSHDRECRRDAVVQILVDLMHWDRAVTHGDPEIPWIQLLAQAERDASAQHHDALVEDLR